MSNFKRYIITKKDNTFLACRRVFNKQREASLETLYEGETKDRLWSNMKRKGAGIRHYRRRGEWVVISESEIKKPVVNKES